jgi:hypothetical protein
VIEAIQFGIVRKFWWEMDYVMDDILELGNSGLILWGMSTCFDCVTQFVYAWIKYDLEVGEFRRGSSEFFGISRVEPEFEIFGWRRAWRAGF